MRDMWTHLRHDLSVGLLLRVGPVDDHIAAPDLDAAAAQPPFGQRRCLVRFVLEEAESSVFLPVVWRAVDDHVHQALCDRHTTLAPNHSTGSAISGMGELCLFIAFLGVWTARVIRHLRDTRPQTMNIIYQKSLVGLTRLKLNFCHQSNKISKLSKKKI